MACTKDHESSNGECPRCVLVFSVRTWADRSSGQIEDGLLWVTCPNCQSELELRLSLTLVEVVS